MSEWAAQYGTKHCIGISIWHNYDSSSSSSHIRSHRYYKKNKNKIHTYLGNVPRKNGRRFIARISSLDNLDISAGIPKHSPIGTGFRSPFIHIDASVRSIFPTSPSSLQVTPFKSHLLTVGSPQLSNCNPQCLPIVYVYSNRNASRSDNSPSPSKSP